MESKRKIIAAGIIGNVIEYYDFALIGFLAVMMGELFFPSNDPFLSLLGSFGAFAAGMIMRPVGAMIFGHIGDRIGRRFALIASLALMALPTFMIGLLPTYAQIGIAAPILLVILRMVQGLSVGGEYASSIVYLVEHASTNRRNLYGSFVSIGAKIGMALGSAICGVLLWSLGSEQMGEWGWRVPFLLSILIAAAGLYLRRNLSDNYQPKEEKTIPLIEIFRHHKKVFGWYVTLASIVWMFYYTLFIYMPVWLEKIVGFSKEDAGLLNTFSIVLGAVSILVMALMADRFGSHRVMKGAAFSTMVLIIPSMLLIMEGSFFLSLTSIGVLVILLCAFQAPIFASTVYAIQEHGNRASFTALILGSAAGIVGGTTPAMMTMLVEYTGNPLAPAYAIALSSMIGLAVLSRLRD